MRADDLFIEVPEEGGGLVLWATQLELNVHRWQTVTVHVAETTLAIELDHGETRVIRRTTTTAVRNIKADRPRTALSVS